MTLSIRGRRLERNERSNSHGSLLSYPGSSSHGVIACISCCRPSRSDLPPSSRSSKVSTLSPDARSIFAPRRSGSRFFAVSLRHRRRLRDRHALPDRREMGSWYSDATANVVGPLLAYEGLTAFFLEAAFLGVLLFGRKLLPAWAHFVAALMVALGPLLSTSWILATNSWMQTPAGYEIVEGRFLPEGLGCRSSSARPFPTGSLIPSTKSISPPASSLSASRPAISGTDGSSRKRARCCPMRCGP